MENDIPLDLYRKGLLDQLRHVSPFLLPTETPKMAEYLWITLRSQGGMALLTRPLTHEGIRALAIALKPSGEVNSEVNQILESIAEVLNDLPIPVVRAYIGGDYGYITSPGYHRHVKLIIYIKEKIPFSSSSIYELVYECLHEHYQMWNKVANDIETEDIASYARENIKSKCKVRYFDNQIQVQAADCIWVNILLAYGSNSASEQSHEEDMVIALKHILTSKTSGSRELFNLRWSATVEELRCNIMKLKPDYVLEFCRFIKYMGACTGLDVYISPWALESIAVGVTLEMLIKDIKINLVDCLSRVLVLLRSPAEIQKLEDSYKEFYEMALPTCEHLTEVMSGMNFPRNEDLIRLRDPLNYSHNILDGISTKDWDIISKIANVLLSRMSRSQPMCLAEYLRPVAVYGTTTSVLCKLITRLVTFTCVILAILALVGLMGDAEMGDFMTQFDHWVRNCKQMYFILRNRLRMV